MRDGSEYDRIDPRYRQTWGVQKKRGGSRGFRFFFSDIMFYEVVKDQALIKNFLIWPVRILYIRYFMSLPHTGHNNYKIRGRVMKVIFLGTGEACDEHCPNTSILIKINTKGRDNSILLDCGFATPHHFFRYVADANELDILWISHFHGDHFFGVPLLLLRFWEMGREMPLTIAGPAPVRKMIFQSMELAYPGFFPRLQYPVTFVEIEPENQIDIHGLFLRTAPNEHSMRSLAVRIDDNGRSVFYSGDGRPTAKTLDLAQGCDLVIHEAFTMDDPPAGHGSVQGCIDFAKEAHAPRLALVHIQREVRPMLQQKIVQLCERNPGLEIMLPAPGNVLDL